MKYAILILLAALAFDIRNSIYQIYDSYTKSKNELGGQLSILNDYEDSEGVAGIYYAHPKTKGLYSSLYLKLNKDESFELNDIENSLERVGTWKLIGNQITLNKRAKKEVLVDDINIYDFINCCAICSISIDNWTFSYHNNRLKRITLSPDEQLEFIKL